MDLKLLLLLNKFYSCLQDQQKLATERQVQKNLTAELQAQPTLEAAQRYDD